MQSKYLLVYFFDLQNVASSTEMEIHGELGLGGSSLSNDDFRRIYQFTSVSLNSRCPQIRILWKWTKGDDEKDWRRLNLIYFKNCVCAHLGSLFLWPRFPLHTCARGWTFFHCDQQVVGRALVERGLGGPHDTMISFGGSWGYSGILIWLSLSEKFTLHHSSSLFLGQVISLAYWKSIMAGSILPVLIDFRCSTRLRNLILHDLIGVTQSITARLNSFLRLTITHVIITVERATGPPVWGVRYKLN